MTDQHKIHTKVQRAGLGHFRVRRLVFAVFSSGSNFLALLLKHLDNPPLPNNTMDKIHHTRCLVCGYTNAIVFAEFKYNGLRGSCPRCDGNWPES
jgi:hypothetical protein